MGRGDGLYWASVRTHPRGPPSVLTRIPVWVLSQARPVKEWCGLPRLAWAASLHLHRLRLRMLGRCSPVVGLWRVAHRRRRAKGLRAAKAAPGHWLKRSPLQGLPCALWGRVILPRKAGREGP